MARDPKKPIGPPPKFGQPEKKDWRVITAFWVFVVAAVIGIIVMASNSKRQGNLVCNSSVRAGLTSFGSCHEE